jgi:UDP-N-acetylmuramate-alanine ligase
LIGIAGAGMRALASILLDQGWTVSGSDLNVDSVKKLAGEQAPQSEPNTLKAADVHDVHTRAAEDKLRLVLGTRVRIVRKGERGRIEIDFGSEDELIRLFEQLTEPD